MIQSGGQNIPIGFLWVILLVVVMTFVLNHTRIGRYTLAIGSYKEATRLSGVCDRSKSCEESTGTLFGVFVICLLKTGLPFIGLTANWQQIITGFVLIAAVLVDILKRKSGKE